MTILIFLLFLCLSLSCFRKRLWLGGQFILGVYTFSLFFSVIYKSISKEFYDITFISASVFFILIYLVIKPFLIVKPSFCPITNDQFTYRFRILGYLISLILLLGVFCLLTKIQEAFAYGLVDARQAMYKDEDVLTSYTTLEHVGHSILRWMSGLCYPLIVMFFYSIAFLRKSKLLNTLMILSSLSASYFGLLNGGRTNILYWILFFLFCTLIFWEYLGKRGKKNIFLFGSLILSVLIFYTAYMTIGRSELYNIDQDSFLMHYIGTPFLNFNQFFNNCEFHPYSFRRVFPIITTIFEGRFNLGEYRIMVYNLIHMDIGLFYTLFGDIFVDLGLIGAIVFASTYNIITQKILKTQMHLSDLLLVGISAQIVLHGLFYYSMYKIETNVCAILIIIFANYLKRYEH